MQYIGRFAPSPSGPLHFGSLTTAVASYLDARSNQGKWLVRIDNIDPLREPSGAADNILSTLESYGLHWDDSIIYQGEREHSYQTALEQLRTQNWLFHCQCTRAKIAGQQVYPGHCREALLPSQNTATRIRIDNGIINFRDELQGDFSINKQTAIGDFILKRKDGLWAYQLATALDDAEDGITHVVRGIDLLESSFRQVWLQEILNKSSPIYSHLPIITTSDGQKLSKQNHAKPVEQFGILHSLRVALTILGLPELPDLPHSELLVWATQHWNINRLKHQKSILIPEALIS